LNAPVANVGGGDTTTDTGDTNGGNTGAEESENTTPKFADEIPLAVMAGADDAVLLSPGIMFDGSYLEDVYYQDMTGADRIHSSGACETAGSVAVASFELESVESPFSGALFETGRINYTACEGENFGEGVVDGYMAIGYPDSGVGSGNFGLALNFIVREEMGESLANPLFIEGSNQETKDVLVFGEAHAQVDRYTSLGNWGESGGDMSVDMVQRVADSSNDSIVDTRWGMQGAQFEYERRPGLMGVEPNNTEYYKGVYGKRYILMNGAEVPSTCPQGLVVVETTTDLQVDVPSNTIESGTVKVNDSTGAAANVTYDGGSDLITVSFNKAGQMTTKTYTSAEVAALRMARCGF